MNDDTVTEAISAVPEQIIQPIIKNKTTNDKEQVCWDNEGSDTEGALQGHT